METNKEKPTVPSSEYPYTTFEPKFSHLFTAKLGEPFNLHNYTIHTANRPSFSRVNGKTVWHEMILSCYDPIAPSTSQLIIKGNEILDIQENQTVPLTIDLLDQTGVGIEHWDIIGEITSIDMGTLSWFTPSMRQDIKIYYKVVHATLVY